MNLDNICLKLTQVSFHDKKKNKKILENVDLTINPSDTIVVIGGNGSGKSTLLKICLGLIKPTSGNVWRDKSIAVGYLPEDTGLYANETVENNIAFFHKLKTGKKINSRNLNDILQDLGMPKDIGKRKVIELSKGQRQKIQWLVSTMHNPSFIVLDEPFSGLDQNSTDWILEQIEILKNQGKTFLISAHYIKNLERIITKAYFLKEGKIENGISGESSIENIEKEKNEIIVAFSEEISLCPIQHELIAIQRKGSKTTYLYSVKLTETVEKKHFLVDLIQKFGDKLIHLKMP